MAAKIITPEDLVDFKTDLLSNIEKIISKHNSNSPKTKWIKTSEAKELLGVSVGTLQNLRVNGTLQYAKLGGVIYYDYNKIMHLLDENIVNVSE